MIFNETWCTQFSLGKGEVVSSILTGSTSGVHQSTIGLGCIGDYFCAIGRCSVGRLKQGRRGSHRRVVTEWLQVLPELARCPHPQSIRLHWGSGFGRALAAKRNRPIGWAARREKAPHSKCAFNHA
jgi:hypothetical protein